MLVPITASVAKYGHYKWGGCGLVQYHWYSKSPADVKTAIAVYGTVPKSSIASVKHPTPGVKLAPNKRRKKTRGQQKGGLGNAPLQV